MKIKSDLLRAAMHATAKEDVRRYLCGIHITRKHVQASNGHIALQMEHGAKIRNPITIIIKGKIPVKSIITKFEFVRDGKMDGLAKHYDALGFITAIHAIEVIEQRFPDFTKDILFGDLTKFDFKNPMPAINPEYMGLPTKMFPKEKFTSMRAAPSDNLNSAVLFHFSGFVREHYGNPQFIVMPMRWEE